MRSPKLILDTNAVIALLDGGSITGETRTALDDAEVSVSIITRIELYAKPMILIY